MLEKYGKKGKIWSNYLKRCLEHNSFIIPESLSKNKKKVMITKSFLKSTLEDEAISDGTSSEAASMLNDGDIPLQPPPPQGEFSQGNLCCHVLSLYVRLFSHADDVIQRSSYTQVNTINYYLVLAVFNVYLPPLE